MSHYVYLISDHSHKHIHAGYSDDIEKTKQHYKLFSDHSLCYKPNTYLNRMVYCEKVWNEGQAIDRVTYFTHVPLSVRVEQIVSVNPEWDDLAIDEGFLTFLQNN